MTLRDLRKVYGGMVFITVLGYYDDGTYYSFYSGTDELTCIDDLMDSYLADLEIRCIRVGWNGELRIDVKTTVTRSETGES